jgi:hypothetical protein
LYCTLVDVLLNISLLTKMAIPAVFLSIPSPFWMTMRIPGYG